MKQILLFLLLLAAGTTAKGATGSTRSEPLRQSAAPAAVGLRTAIIPKGRVGRNREFPLKARYITIHSTANPGGTAAQHARGLVAGNFRGKSKWNRTGYVTWHFSVDDREAVQSLPLNIQGEHADHDGPGNKSSIAIEICEVRRQSAAIDRAARLTAWLMHDQKIPLDHVVPHYHWPQKHFHNHQKNCPRILLDGGKPGPRWAAFLRKVRSYY